MGRTSIIVTAVFAALLLLLEGLLAFYWYALLEPRLRSDAEAHAKLLAQSHEGLLVSALASAEAEARRKQVVDAMDRILLLREPVSDTPFVTAIRLEVDYEVVDETAGSLDISRGAPGKDAFQVDVGLYDPDTFELMGIAWLDMSPAFFDRLSNDVRRQLVLQGTVVFLILVAVWAFLLVILGKFERINEARRLAEQRLRVHEKKFGRLLDDLGTYFVYSRDRSGRLSEVSDSVERVLGLEPEGFVSGYRDQLSEDGINVSAVMRLTSPPEECGAGRAEVEIRDAAGGLHRIELTEVLVSDENGRIAGIDGIAHDVTEQRAFELALRDARAEAEEANLAKSQFLANVSHEVRTPMNAILGMTILALRTDLDSRQRNYLEKINSSGRLLLRIINDILDLSRIDAGKLTIQRVEFRLDDVLNDLSGVVGEKAREKGLEVLFAVSPDVPRHLRGDPARLEQVLVNLVSNAVKFTLDGEIVVTVAPVSVDRERIVIRFEVRDTGPGIPAGEIDRLFDPFTQVDESNSRRHGGVGLGLAISKRLVELMGGEITCESELGIGSTFRFTVVVEAAERAGRSLRRGDLEGLSVLVVDDNPMARQVFTEMLRSLGFDTTTAPRAEIALDELKRRQRQGKPVSLVLMDWKMPGLDGVEAAARIKAGLGGALEPVPPVVLVTAYGGADIMRQAESAGVDAFVNKPVSRSALWNAVLEALGRPEDAEDECGPALLDSIRFRDGLRILIVEDNDLNREVARELLGAVGLGVDEAANGPDALEAIGDRRPDLVLMDVHMPGMDGLEVTRRIRQAPDGGDLPVIALTAHAMMGDRQRFLDDGMDDYVAKPIEEDQLFEVLARWLPHEVVPVTADRATPERELPLIPGVDVARAARRLRGDVRLLQRLVGDLANRFSDAAGEIDRAIESGRFDDAANLAHTLRGAAGSLVARRVSDAAGAIETAIRSGEDARPLVPPLAEALRELAEGQPDGATPESAEPVGTDRAEPANEQAVEALERLIDHLSSNSLGAVEALEHLRQALNGRENAVIRSMEDHVDSLRFERALELAQELSRAFGVDAGGAA